LIIYGFVCDVTVVVPEHIEELAVVDFSRFKNAYMDSVNVHMHGMEDSL
jgi:hypothetical protein